MTLVLPIRQCASCGEDFTRYNTIQKLCRQCTIAKATSTSVKPRKPIQARGKRSKKWDAFRDKVARPYLDKTQGLVCVDCRKLPPMRDDGTYMRHDVDHIKGRGSHPELAFDVTNMVYRCRSCHIKKTGVPQWSRIQG